MSKWGLDHEFEQNPITRITLMEWTNKWLKTYKENKVRETTYKGIYHIFVLLSRLSMRCDCRRTKFSHECAHLQEN